MDTVMPDNNIEAAKARYKRRLILKHKRRNHQLPTYTTTYLNANNPSPPGLQSTYKRRPLTDITSSNVNVKATVSSSRIKHVDMEAPKPCNNFEVYQTKFESAGNTKKTFPSYATPALSSTMKCNNKSSAPGLFSTQKSTPLNDITSSLLNRSTVVASSSSAGINHCSYKPRFQFAINQVQGLPPKTNAVTTSFTNNSQSFSNYGSPTDSSSRNVTNKRDAPTHLSANKSTPLSDIRPSFQYNSPNKTASAKDVTNGLQHKNIEQSHIYPVNLATKFDAVTNTAFPTSDVGSSSKNHSYKSREINALPEVVLTPSSTSIPSSKRKHDVIDDENCSSSTSINLSDNCDDDFNYDSPSEQYISDSDAEDEDFSESPPMPNCFTSQGYSDIGDPICECQSCGAMMWYQERREKYKHTTMPKFQFCCGNGKVQLPLLKKPPELLEHLLFDTKSKESKLFQQNIRMYNSMFAFTSPGMKFDKSFKGNRGPPVLRLHGQPCHRIGSMLPKQGDSPKFAQLYIYDTENELHNRIQSCGDNKEIDVQIVSNLGAMLDQHNVHAKVFRMARERLKQGDVGELKLRLIHDRKTDGRIYNQPTVSEVAALIVGDIDQGDTRDIIVEEQSGKLERISEFHPSYLAYQYPLLFPYGEDGFRRGTLHKERPNVLITIRNRLTIMDFLSFRIQMRNIGAQTLMHSRRLFQQFLVDGFTMMESERLSWVRNNQSTLRVGKYQKLNHKQGNEEKSGKRVVLPSSFVGSKRYMDQLYFDGMAISASVGFPDLFITFTCNPNWPEIQRLVAKSNLKPHDRPDIIARVFKIKFNELLNDLTKKHVLGKVIAHLYTIEFQKRGLPHAHILLFLHPSSKYPTPDDIDKIISAEVPNPESQTELYNLVSKHMVHGPCGIAHRSSPCMTGGKCSKYFPKKIQEKTVVDQDGHPMYRRRSNGYTIDKNGITMDNRHVVPYNPFLLLKYLAHINMEWCNQCTSIKYLFKYINKGYDRITASVSRSNKGSKEKPTDIDEVKEYIDCRYVSPAEACWRIFSFGIHGRKPAVERLFYHLEGEHSVYFQDYENIDDILLKPSVTESMFTAWLEANQKYTEARSLTYGQFVSKFVYVKKQREWKPRKRGFTIGRLIWVPPSTGELYYFRMMLTVVKGPTSYKEIMKIGDTQYLSYRDACFAMGFLEDDREYINAIKEAKDWGSGHFLRKLFVIMLLSNTMNRPKHVWDETKSWLADGILYKQRLIANNKDLQLSEEEIENLTLIEIEKHLESNRKTLKDFPSIPYPRSYLTAQLGNRLIYDERNYDVEEQQQEFQSLFQAMTVEQRGHYHTIMKAVRMQKGGVFFLHGYGGTGKTFMWRTLASSLRSKKHIVITVASSGIASLLLPGGRTAHSKFKIPVQTLDNSTCDIHYDDELAELIREAKLIIWDEAPMAHRYTFEALDKTFKDIMSKDKNTRKVFGGKVIVFGGDFRQILPVVPGGSRSDIVHATINSSKIWNHCTVLTLTQNMRLQNSGNPEEIRKFSEWTLKVGEGKLSEPNDGYAEIEIPQEHLILNYDDPISAIVDSTYPNLIDDYKKPEFLKSRAILASTVEIVEQINTFVLTQIPGDSKDYYSCDSIDRSDVNDCEIFNTLTPEFLNSLRTFGLPNHKISMKIGTPIMLMRNLDQHEGLCNCTRLIVTKLANSVIEAKIISGKNIGQVVYLPRMSMSPSQSPWPFKLKRIQFPIIVSYAMTINKSQGQSLDNVGLYLPKEVFSHGQLYVAISRVTRKDGLKILIFDKDQQEDQGKPTSTTNVVFKEVFENLNMV